MCSLAHSAAETVQRALGEPIDPGPLLADLEAKYGRLYGLDS